jgi:peptidoglycan/xylan/chitin deacetylase (PgdA/CDA1 family)
VAAAIRTAIRGLRELAYRGLSDLGALDRIAASAWRQRRLVIMAYHGVSLHDEHQCFPELFVTPEFLERRFGALRRGKFNVLRLEEAAQRLQEGTLPQRSVALTFDDGFYNFHAAALPLLDKFGYPATNYASTYYVLNQRPIPGLALQYILWRARSKSLSAGTLPGQTKAVDLGSERQREELALTLLPLVEGSVGNQRRHDEYLYELSARLDVDFGEIVDRRLLHLMTLDELKEASARGVDVQLHTHRHRTPRDETAFRREVIQNREILEFATRCPAVHFCYPSGDVDRSMLPWLRQLGVITATTCDAGLATALHDPLMLPRYVDTMLQSDIMFEAWLTGATQVLSFRPARS